MRTIISFVAFMLILLLATIPAAAKTGQDFYDCTVIEKNGNKHRMVGITSEDLGLSGSSKASFKYQAGGKKSSFKFSELKEIHVTGTPNKPFNDYVAAQVTKINDETVTVYIYAPQGKLKGVKGKLFRKGDDPDAGKSFIFTEIDRIIFPHTGLKMTCGVCQSYFYNPKKKTCPFDGEILTVVTKGLGDRALDDDLEEVGESLLVPVQK